MALKFNPDSSECHFNLANAFNDNHQKKEALFHFIETLKYDP